VSDIVERLNSAGDLAIPGEPRRLFYDAANEIERLHHVVGQKNLTDEERAALDTAEASLIRESTDLHTPLIVRQRLGAAAATLQRLLERLGGGK
jgi:uncharacterized protein YfaA (DUF2138 family)